MKKLHILATSVTKEPKIGLILGMRPIQYYTANAIFTGQTEPRSIFPKPPSPTKRPKNNKDKTLRTYVKPKEA